MGEDWFGGPAFHRELTVLLDEDGNPLWDGEAEREAGTTRNSGRDYAELGSLSWRLQGAGTL
jgi:hypothetical protein